MGAFTEIPKTIPIRAFVCVEALTGIQGVCAMAPQTRIHRNYLSALCTIAAYTRIKGAFVLEEVLSQKRGCLQELLLIYSFLIGFVLLGQPLSLRKYLIETYDANSRPLTLSSLTMALRTIRIPLSLAKCNQTHPQHDKNSNTN